MLTAPLLEVEPALRHGFFTRLGGVSEGIYTSLNCGLGSRDEPERVHINRRRALARLDLAPERLCTVYQHHSNIAVATTEAWAFGALPRADAMVTREAGLALGILTADCAPVLFADIEARVIG
ncbi:MAG: polyphenol oxidase, partial [Alphaproteobacteria bacterium]|nr:polyphenol oxidase [Alphaproteobacteria bacterium]